jgi:hypothetical protein
LCSIRWFSGDLERRGRGPADRGPAGACAQLLGVDLATVHELAAKVEPYLRADGTRVWSLTQLERQLRPEVYGRAAHGKADAGVDWEAGYLAATHGHDRGPGQHLLSP